MTVTFAAWWVPLFITIVALLPAFFYDDGTRGMMSGLANIALFFIGCIVSLLAWLVWALLR